MRNYLSFYLSTFRGSIAPQIISRLGRSIGTVSRAERRKRAYIKNGLKAPEINVVKPIDTVKQ